MKVGDVINAGAERYQVSELIASGGFGSVFRMERTAPSPATLAVKVLKAEFAGDEEYRRRFQREARILGNLNHRNVVRICAVWNFPDGELAIVQEYVPGAQELAAYLPTASAGRQLSVVLQVMYGLRAAHGPELRPAAIHRDLSPRNVLISSAGEVKVIDFGLAREDPRVTEVLTVLGYTFGTPGCIAPEQAASPATVDHRADLYSLGRTIAAALQRRMPLHAHPETLSPPWRDICVQLTAYSASDRFESAEAAARRFMADFAAAGIVVEDFGLHIEEVASWSKFPKEFVDCVRIYLQALSPLPQSVLGVLRRLPIDALRHFEPGVLDDLFCRLDVETVEARFGSGMAPFESVDPVTDLYRGWFPFLGQGARLKAFRRLVRLAVDYHRYPAMSNVRGAYQAEVDTGMRTQLEQILLAEDPTGVVHGRGIFPASVRA